VTTLAGTASTYGGFGFTTSPVINMVSPMVGPVGTTVTISGANFQAIAANNVVYFGAVKANIISASANTITTSVPAGATYKPISVSTPVNGLTAYSDARFDVTFPVDTSAFNDSSFAGRMDLATGQQPYDVKQGDLDGDGKPDLAIINYGSTFISIYRNMSSPGRLTFSSRIDIETGSIAKSIAIADMDGDGKLDLIISNGLNIFIFKNTSSPGNISFINSYTIGGYLFPADFMEIADFDLDGHPDIVFLCGNCGVTNGGIFISQNLSSNGNFSFSQPALVYFGVNQPSYGITAGLAITDFNNDGRPDIIVGLWSSAVLFFVKNETALGDFIHFSVTSVGDLGYPDPNYSLTPYIGNFSGPGLPDFVSNRFVYKNNGGTFSSIIATDAKVSYVYDLNGDGKQDILGSHITTGELSLIKNTSDISGISFAPSYDAKNPGGTVCVGDLDGDSKPEICILYRSLNILRILRNRMNESLPPPPSITSFTPDSGSNFDEVTIVGSNLDEVLSVTFGGVPALFYTITSPDSIVATVGSGASGAVAVTNLAGKDSLNGFTYLTRVPPVITSFTPTASGYLGNVTIYGKHFDSATAVSFGGNPAAGFTIQSPTIISAKLEMGNSGDVTVASPYGTANKPGFIFYYPPVIDSISPTNGIAGTSITISGQNLADATAVTFGNVSATSFTVMNSTTITATVGAGASGDVSVTTPWGTATHQGFTFGVVTGVRNINGNSNDLKVSPNPANNYVIVEHPSTSKSANLRFVDMFGRVMNIVSVNRNSAKTQVNTIRLAAGVYKIVWTDGQHSLTKTLLILK
jgi:VCBS repeat protein/IPT/TIG domain-containing protein/type IX secretion system substrate protein